VNGTVHVCISNKFPLFSHVEDEEETNVQDSAKETGGKLNAIHRLISNFKVADDFVI